MLLNIIRHLLCRSRQMKLVGRLATHRALSGVNAF
jgi:hypothetical protein